MKVSDFMKKIGFIEGTMFLRIVFMESKADDRPEITEIRGDAPETTFDLLAERAEEYTLQHFDVEIGGVTLYGTRTQKRERKTKPEKADRVAGQAAEQSVAELKQAIRDLLKAIAEGFRPEIEQASRILKKTDAPGAWEQLKGSVKNLKAAVAGFLKMIFRKGAAEK